MKYIALALLIILAFGVFGTHRTIQRSASERERQFVMRSSIFGWAMAFLILAGVFFLPGRALVLLLIPACVLGASFVRACKNTRLRLRAEEAARFDIDRMKRVN